MFASIKCQPAMPVKASGCGMLVIVPEPSAPEFAADAALRNDRER